LGDQAGLAATLQNMGQVALAQHDFSRAPALFTRSSDIYAAIRLEKDMAREEETIAQVEALMKTARETPGDA
jgi:hypothetical protein